MAPPYTSAMADTSCTTALAEAPPDAPVRDGVEAQARARIRAMVDAHYDFVWRTLRLLGVDDAGAEDGAQQVMCVLARRIDEIEPGTERSFLFSAARRVAANLRRAARRRPATGDVDLDTLAASLPHPDALLDARRAHELLERVIAAMPFELRLVFALHEIEEMTTPEIAQVVGIPVPTAASRLRRAREAFRAIVRRLDAAQRSRP